MLRNSLDSPFYSNCLQIPFLSSFIPPSLQSTSSPTFTDGNPENHPFLAHISRDETLNCLQQLFPFLVERNLIVDTEYRLNMLDMMEVLIALLMKELEIVKQNRARREHEEKLKSEKDNSKKAKKSAVRKK